MYYLPVLFLPNLGFGQVTEFGTFELSDVLIGPYLVLVWLAADLKRRTLIDKVAPMALVFIVWALVSTLLINVRYDYADNHYLYFGLYKLAKFVLYGLAGFLTSRALVDDRTRRDFARSLVMAALVVGIGLATVGQKSNAGTRDIFAGYKASNGISVMAAMLACYLCGLWLRRKGIGNWTRKFILVALCALVFGSAISEGRGGWVAGIAGLLYLCYQGGLRRGVVALMVGAPVMISLLYAYSPVFRNRVEFTLFPDSTYLATYGSGVGGIDDGARVVVWRDELGHFDAPVFGTGFFHRGGESGLSFSGSHNFFLQMFLETGIPGGLLMLIIFYRLWYLAGSHSARVAGLDLPVKAALVAAIVGGFSGEYFYGGVIPFALLAVCAACGSLPAGLPVRIARPSPQVVGFNASITRSR